MAGTIICDYIRTDANQLSLNVGNTTFATINASGFFSNTGTQLIAANGKISGASIISSSIPSAAIADNAITRAKMGYAGAVLQVATTTLDGVLSGGSGGNPSVITNGVQVFSLSFTPIYASSLILVQTSTMNVMEESNGGDYTWLALWDGSTFIAANSGHPGYNHWGGNLDTGMLSLNNSYVAGSTATRTISVRAGLKSGTVYVNGNSLGTNYSGSSARLQMTVWEIEQ
jgi:hypothetical protein